MTSFIAIDFETANQHRSSICSVGVVFVENSKIVDKVYELINPIPNFYSDRNTQVHGISYYDTIKARSFKEFWLDILHLIEDKPFVAHNKSFDEKCLKSILTEYEMDLPTNEFFCTYREAKKRLPDLTNHQLHTVAKHFGYDLTNHHNAIADAEACAHIAINLF